MLKSVLSFQRVKSYLHAKFFIFLFTSFCRRTSSYYPWSVLLSRSLVAVKLKRTNLRCVCRRACVVKLYLPTPFQLPAFVLLDSTCRRCLFVSRNRTFAWIPTSLCVPDYPSQIPVFASWVPPVSGVCSSVVTERSCGLPPL